MSKLQITGLCIFYMHVHLQLARLLLSDFETHCDDKEGYFIITSSQRTSKSAPYSLTLTQSNQYSTLLA